MKQMRKILAAAVAVLMAAGILSGCSLLGGIKLEELEGTWCMVKEDTREEAMSLLENIEAYEEEIALADLDSLEYVKVVHFASNKTYYYGYDVEGTKACVRDFYDRYFNALYQGRSTLNEAYGEVFDDMSQAEFRQYYAELYGYTDYIELLDTFAEIAYDYEALEDPTETGTFQISGDEILCTITGENVEEAMGVKLDADTLTLTYIDGVEVYTRDE